MRRVTGMALLASLAGCATPSPPLGHDYAQAAFDRFVLNETTVDEAEALLGPPMRQSTLNSLPSAAAKRFPAGIPVAITTLNYYYAPLGLGQRGPHPAKVAGLIFLSGHLIGYQFSNSIPGEVTPPISDDRLSALHQGQTTRAEAIALLGTPLRQLMHVYDGQSGASEIAYGWVHRHEGQVDQRTLRINFDRSGRMTTYAVLQNSFPAGGAPMLQLPQIPPPSSSSPPSSPMPEHLVPHGDREHT